MTKGKTRNYQLELHYERLRLNATIVKNWHGVLRLNVEVFSATPDKHLPVSKCTPA